MSIKDDYFVQAITKDDYEMWLLKKHYAHRIPSVMFAFGLYVFDRNQLVGVCTLGSPPSAPLVEIMMGGFYKEKILELNRLVVAEGLPRNILSYFVSQCLRYLPRPRCIVSFADPNQGHSGYIYQATNWIYTGTGAATPNYYLEDGRQIHSKWVKKYKDRGHEIRQIVQLPKHRYIFFVGSRTEQKNMAIKLKWPALPYPKGDNKRYDSSYEPEIQTLLF